MYVAEIPNRNSPPAILLRESYREGGKVKTRTLTNLSMLPAEAIAVLRQSLQGKKLVDVREGFEVLSSPHHGHVEAVMIAMRKLGFAEILGSRPSRERDLALAMVAARILEPDSKLATTRWWHVTTLPATVGVSDADEDELYAAMDWLLARQDRIEKKLAARHLASDGMALYDLTSSYFEGTSCPLAALGHPRDGKKGKLQVNYGLLTDPRGRPVSVSVFKGNTGDPKTLLPQVDKMRKDFNIQRFVLVGDRGMITQKQVDVLRGIDHIDWITALRTEAIRKLVEEGRVQRDLFDERDLFEITHPDFPGERLVACRNPQLAHRRAEKRKALLEATGKELEKVRQMVKRGRLYGKEVIGEQVRKVLSQGNVGRHFEASIRDDGFDFEFNKAKVIDEATLPAVQELDKVRRMVAQGRLSGKQDIGKRVATALNRRKVGQHFKVDIRDDGFDFEFNEAKVVAEATGIMLKKLDKVRRMVERGRLYGQDEIGLRVGKVVNKYKVGKHFKLDIHNDRFDFNVDEEKVAAEAALDGIYIIRTSLPAQRMSTEDTVRSYKLLSQVERAFRSIKTMDLLVRPIWHRLEDRVRAHIFLCMLAYYVEWHMLEAWRPILFCDEDQTAKASRAPVAAAQRSEGALRKVHSRKLNDGSQVHSFQTLLKLLSGIVRNICRIPGTDPNGPTFEVVTTPTATQQRAYDLLGSIEV